MSFMNRYIPADKLKAEIERREKILRNSANQISNSEKKTYYLGCADALLELLPYIPSLQQEQPEAEKRITITLSSFDIKLIYNALERERTERLSKTPWENRNPQVYPPQYSHDYNAKPVRQVDSTLRFIKRQIEQMNSRKED